MLLSKRLIIIASATVVCLASWVTCCKAQQSDLPEVECASPLGNKDVGKTETAIGDLTADAIRYVLRTDVAFIAASEIKPKDPPIPAGKVTLNDIRPLISYPDDPLAVLELTGSAIKEALERAVSIYPLPNLAFLQVSGIQFVFDPKRPSGGRIVSVTIAGAPLKVDATYTVAVTNSMANGALGYWKIWKEKDVKARRPDTSIVKALEAFFKANPRIDYSKLDRIKPTQ